MDHIVLRKFDASLVMTYHETLPGSVSDWVSTLSAENWEMYKNRLGKVVWHGKRGSDSLTLVPAEGNNES